MTLTLPTCILSHRMTSRTPIDEVFHSGPHFHGESGGGEGALQSDRQPGVEDRPAREDQQETVPHQRSAATRQRPF
jgi:hypothetical protein